MNEMGLLKQEKKLLLIGIVPQKVLKHIRMNMKENILLRFYVSVFEMHLVSNIP